MIIQLHPSFKKRFRKLPVKIREAFFIRLELFLVDPGHPLLKTHSIDKAYPGHRSINVTGDYRALYKPIGEKMIFTDIGTHSQLYG